MLMKTCPRIESASPCLRKKREKMHRFFAITLSYVAIKFITVILFIVITSAAVLQNTTNFDGKWMINISKSDFDTLKTDIAPQQIIVKQSLDSIVLTKTFEHPGAAPNSYTQSFSNNGKPSERIAGGGMERRVTTITTSKDTLIFNTHGYVDNKGLKWEYTATEWWTASADKKSLTVQRKAVLPDRTEIYKAVYDKQ